MSVVSFDRSTHLSRFHVLHSLVSDGPMLEVEGVSSRAATGLRMAVTIVMRVESSGAERHPWPGP